MSAFCRELFVERFQSAIRSARSDAPTDALARIASFAQRIVVADAAGFSLAHPDGHLITIGETNHLMITMDCMQTHLQEGPGIDVIVEHSADIVACSDLVEEARWPRWCPLAAQLGFRSVVSMGISDAAGGPPATFTLFRACGPAFDAEDLQTVRTVLAEAARLEEAARMDEVTCHESRLGETGTEPLRQVEASGSRRAGV